MADQHRSGREIINVSGLNAAVRKAGKDLVLLRDVDFSLHQGEIHGLVGESGCGKSLFARTLVRLEAPARVVSGSIIINGSQVADKPARVLSLFRGKSISLVLQDPTAAVDPLFTMESQFQDALSILPKSRRSMARVYELLEEVGIASPDIRCRQYPHQWSRGMLQRAQLVMVLLSNPDSMILDEVTSALDPTIVLQMIELIARFSQTRQTAFILITHDLAMAAHICDRISVMHQGTIIETQDTASLLEHPRHSYTQNFLSDIGGADHSREETCLTP